MGWYPDHVQVMLSFWHKHQLSGHGMQGSLPEISVKCHNMFKSMLIKPVCSKYDLLCGVPAKSYVIIPLWGDKVSMLTHIYPHKPWRNIEVTICKITRLTAHFMCGLMSDLLICTFNKKYGHTWHWMSLLRPDVINQHKLNLCHYK